MIPIDPPSMCVRETLTASLTGMQDSTLKDRLATREPDLSKAELAYMHAAQNNGLYALALAAQTAEQLAPDPDGEQLRNLYSAGLVSRRTGRIKYDELKARAPFGRCLLCGNGEIGSLDHHLPKDSFPLYTICPANLVPACGKCNQAKGNRIGATAYERTIHPYYDRPGDSGRYLFADIQGWPVRFHIRPLPEWDTELSQRLEHHFRVFDLAQRFAEFSVSPLISNQWIHQSLWRSGGPSALAAHLEEDAYQHADSHGLNTWDTALRFGLADSAWYLQHGVNEAP